MSSHYGRSQRLLEVASIALFVLFAAYGACRLVEAARWWTPVLVLFALPCAWLTVDLLSGLAHWAFDSFGSASTPVIGRALIRPFRVHHDVPEEMTHHDFVETHGASCLGSLPFLAAACVLPIATLGEILVQSLLLLSALGALATNQCH